MDIIESAPDLEESVAAIRAAFDAFGDGEFERLDKHLPARVNFEIHRRMLARHLRPGMRVLEIGAAGGKFTLELLRLGAMVTVTDLSPVQIGLNEARVRDHDLAGSVEGWLVLDVREAAARFDAGGFDAVVAYGGPLSYVFEHAATALAGLLEVTRPGGVVLASVMSLLGTWRHSLAGVVDAADTYGQDANNKVLSTGDLRLLGRPESHVCQLYRAGQIPALVERSGGVLLEASASNWASLGDQAALERLAADPEKFAVFLDFEERACAEPGALDGGTHILFAAAPPQGRRPDPGSVTA
jgi:2-polyprenyl-3-methyl-5-hydroxy-6-metoxy-1,4-benzoquinol methylase